MCLVRVEIFRLETNPRHLFFCDKKGFEAERFLHVVAPKDFEATLSFFLCFYVREEKELLEEMTTTRIPKHVNLLILSREHIAIQPSTGIVI